MKVFIAIISILFVVAESFNYQEYTKQHFISKIPKAIPANDAQVEEHTKYQGKLKSKLSPYIVGGQVSEPHAQPFQAALYIDDTFFCGGSLIDEYYILTAAHCTYKALKIVTQLGAFNRSAEECCQVFRNSTGREIITHSEFNELTLENDIALVRLPTPVVFSNEIKPVSLPSVLEKDLGPGVIVKVSGWGLTSDDPDANTNDVIKEALVPTISNAECVLHYGTEKVRDSVLCTSSAAGNGICYGDSGSPLIYDSGNGPVHRGLVAFIPETGCLSGDPNGFTRTTHYLDWIQQNAGLI